MAELSDRIAANLTVLNVVGLVAAGLLTILLHAGFALVETGLCRAKNAAHTMSMNLMVFAMSSLAFWAFGFALGWGNFAHGPGTAAWTANLGIRNCPLDAGLGLKPEWDPVTGASSGGFKYGIVGRRGFFFGRLDEGGLAALFFFMMALMTVAATIPTGAMAERWNWKNCCWFAIWIAIPFGIYAHWVWGGGLLAQSGMNWHMGHGAVDLAGSGVVHGLGGIVGLVGAVLLGPRTGKYSQGRPQPLPGHHVPMVVTGTLVLAVGWCGANGGCVLAGSDLSLAGIVVNTLLCGAAGSVAAMCTLRAKRMKPDPTLLCNGLLAGLVASSATCGFVDAWAAVFIGAVAGTLVVHSVFFLEKRKIDDPVGAISIHGLSGLWGLLALGLFANGRHGAGWNGVVRSALVERYGSDGVRGLFFGDPSQLMAQLTAAAVLVVFATAIAYVAFGLSQRAAPLRVSREDEGEGLDGASMGAAGYPDFTFAKRG